MLKPPKFLTPKIQAYLRVFALVCNLFTISVSCYVFRLNRRNRQQMREISEACDRISKACDSTGIRLRQLEK